MLNLFVLAQAGAPQQPQGSFLDMLIPFAAIGVIFYFLIIRPQTKKAREQQALISSLKSGDKVITNGGIHGLISNVKETTVIVKVADNVKLEIEKSSILTVAKRADDENTAA